MILLTIGLFLLAALPLIHGIDSDGTSGPQFLNPPPDGSKKKFDREAGPAIPISWESFGAKYMNLSVHQVWPLPESVSESHGKSISKTLMWRSPDKVTQFDLALDISMFDDQVPSRNRVTWYFQLDPEFEDESDDTGPRKSVTFNVTDNHRVTYTLTPTGSQPTSTAGSSEDDTRHGEHKGLSTGGVIGVAVAGAVLGLAIFGAGCFFAWRHLRKNKGEEVPTSDADEESKNPVYEKAVDGVVYSPTGTHEMDGGAGIVSPLSSPYSRMSATGPEGIFEMGE